MSSYELWKIIHIVGILTLFGSLGGLAALAQAGAAKAQGKLFRILHGVALAVVLVAGFGLLSTFGLHAPGSWPVWVWIKLVVWLALGSSLVAMRRVPGRAGTIFLILILVGAIAAWAALTKPGV